jgi:outer membrane receptor protein involved in Fe transport
MMLSGSWQRAASERTVWQLSAYGRGGLAQLRSSPFDTPVTSEGERRNTRAGALWSVTHQRGRHVLKAGVEGSWLALGEDFMFAVTDADEAEEAGLSDEALTHGLDNPFVVSASARPTLFSVFAQDTWQASSRVTVDYGFRVDRSRLLERASQFSPRLGVAYQARPGTIVRGSVLRLFQPPQAEYLLLASSEAARALSPFVDETTSGGAALPPERQTAFEASISQDITAHLRLDAGAWLRRGKDVDDPNVFHGTTVTFPNSVATQHAHGIDLRLDLLPAGGFSGSATYSYGRVVQFGPINGGLFLEDEFIEIGEGTEFTPDHDLRHALTVKATYASPARPWRVSGAIRYRTGTPIEVDEDDLEELRDRAGAEVVDFEAGRVRPRLVADVQGQWDVHRGERATTTLVLWMENVADELYAYNFGNPFSGTHFGALRRGGVAVRMTFDR